MPQQSGQPTTPVQYAPSQEDEISLIDIWLVIYRHKNVVITIILLITALGLFVSLIQPKKYSYSTSLEIGSQIIDGKVVLIDKPETVLAKLKESYIPLVIQQYQVNSMGEAKVIEAHIPKNSELIMLEAKGIENHKKIFFEVFGAVVKKVVDDHERIISVIKKGYESSISSVVYKIEGLKERERVFKAKVKRLEKESALIEQEIRSLQNLIEDSISNRKIAVRDINNESMALTLMMLDNEVRNAREKKSELMERLQITIADKRDSLERDIADNQRAQMEYKNKMDELKLKLDNIHRTRQLSEPLQSLKPVGPNRKMIVTLSLVLGVFFGLFAAFIAEFISKARNQINASRV